MDPFQSLLYTKGQHKYSLAWVPEGTMCNQSSEFQAHHPQMLFPMKAFLSASLIHSEHYGKPSQDHTLEGHYRRKYVCPWSENEDLCDSVSSLMARTIAQPSDHPLTALNIETSVLMASSSFWLPNSFFRPTCGSRIFRRFPLSLHSFCPPTPSIADDLCPAWLQRAAFYLPGYSRSAWLGQVSKYPWLSEMLSYTFCNKVEYQPWARGLFKSVLPLVLSLSPWGQDGVSVSYRHFLKSEFNYYLY